MFSYRLARDINLLFESLVNVGGCVQSQSVLCSASIRLNVLVLENCLFYYSEFIIDVDYIIPRTSIKSCFSCVCQIAYLLSFSVVLIYFFFTYIYYKMYDALLFSLPFFFYFFLFIPYL